MSPTERTEIFLQFTAPFSPAWLWLLIPAVLAGGWLLYRIQLEDLARPQRAVLVTLRLALLAALVFLAFRPNLVIRQILEFPGRILVVVDDSRSMNVRDSRMSDARALRAARRAREAGQEAEEEAAAAARPETAWHHMAEQAEDLVHEVRRFQRYSRGADRESDTFWQRAEAAREAMGKAFERIAELGGAAPETPDGEPLATALEEAQTLRERADTFLAGPIHPAARVFDDYVKALHGLAGALRELQQRHDARRLASGDAALAEQARALRSRRRLALAGEAIERLAPRLAEAIPDQQRLAVRASDGRTTPLDAFDAAGLEPAPGETDLLGRLEKIVAEESEFPLSGVLLLSDGRDLSGRPAAPVRERFAQQQTPIFTAGLGATREPIDVAVLSVDAPDHAVTGEPMALSVTIKAVLEAPETTTLSLLQDGAAVAETRIPLDEGETVRTVGLRFEPETAGLFEAAVRLEALAGEAIAAENNAGTFGLPIHEQPVHALMLEDRPRWQSRFVQRVIAEAPYVRLNTITVLTASEAQKLERGNAPGTWPENEAALGMYRLIILGDVAADRLTPAEWEALGRFVRERGGTLLWMPGEDRQAIGRILADRAELPLPRGSEPVPPPAESFARLRDWGLAPAGRLHPMTRALATSLERAAPDPAALGPEAAALLVHRESGAPLFAWSPAGRGRVIELADDQLWRLLNPTRYGAHRRLFQAVVAGAATGQHATEEAEGPAAPPMLRRDAPVTPARHGTQLWLTGGPGTVQALQDGEVVATAPAEPAHEGASLYRAAFGPLPAGKLTFTVEDRPELATPPTVAVADDPELHFFARDEAFLRALARATGGATRDWFDVERFIPELAAAARSRIERNETVYRLWEMGWVLTLLVIILTVEWIWRKWVGLV